MRIDGWESKLIAYLEGARTKPFEWGHHDCALFAAEWVRICTGEDHNADWRGKYQTERGAKIKMTRMGFSGVEDIASAALDVKPITLAQRGDLILNPDGCLGICNGRVSHFVTQSGMTEYPTLICTKAWGVG